MTTAKAEHVLVPGTPPAALPRHIAIVMDGNGRWAQQRGRPRTFGHQAGLKALRRIVEHCGLRHVPEVTLFAFSSENWSRPKAEVSRLMDLLMRALDKETRELHENGVRLEFIGDLSAFAPAMRDSIGRAMEQTRHNSRLRLNVAVNYGGRWDIAQAARSLAQACVRGEMDAADIDEAVLGSRLMLAGHPRLDAAGVASQRSTIVIWDRATGRPRGPAPTWQSTEAADVCRRLSRHAAAVRRRTGLFLSPHYSASKLSLGAYSSCRRAADSS